VVGIRSERIVEQREGLSGVVVARDGDRGRGIRAVERVEQRIAAAAGKTGRLSGDELRLRQIGRLVILGVLWLYGRKSMKLGPPRSGFN
jgi:hypothetical protein